MPTQIPEKDSLNEIEIELDHRMRRYGLNPCGR